MKFKIGARAHDIGVMSSDKLALKTKDLGFSTVQLVPHKAIDNFPADPHLLTPEYIGTVARPWEKAGIQVGLLGSYFNLLEENPDRLKKDIDRFKRYTGFAGQFRCSLVGTETGSYNRDWSFNRKNHSDEAFSKAAAVIDELTGYAGTFGVNVGIEPVCNHTVHSPKVMKKLIDRIDKENLKVIFDPVNLFNPANYKSGNSIIRESFDLYADKIALVHLKDFVISGGLLTRVPLGRGIVDFDYLFSVLNELQPGMEVIIEELEGDELVDSLRFLQKYL